MASGESARGYLAGASLHASPTPPSPMVTFPSLQTEGPAKNHHHHQMPAPHLGTRGRGWSFIVGGASQGHTAVEGHGPGKCNFPRALSSTGRCLLGKPFSRGNSRPRSPRDCVQELTLKMIIQRSWLSLSVDEVWEAHEGACRGVTEQGQNRGRRTSSLPPPLLSCCAPVGKLLSFSELCFLVCKVEIIACARPPQRVMERKGR